VKLSIVGLPIGNLEDISLRALKVLRNTKFIVCEDSRMFSNLWSKLMQFNLVTKFEGKIKFVNDFNEYRILPGLLREMNELEEAVLVSDAGMPLISDPGYKLVRNGLDMGWEINVVPGPTAESAALAMSGLPTDKYLFLGFLPKKSGKRTEMLKNVKAMSETMNFTVVIYESPVRLEKILPEIVDIFGADTPTCLALDITKISEKTFRGNLDKIIEDLSGKKIKGEATLIFSLVSK